MLTRRSRALVACLAATATTLAAWVAGPAVGQSAVDCTEVIGFSQTQEWYEDGGFESLVGADDWQLRWQGGAFVTKWADPDFEGWGDDRLFHACPDQPVGRVVLTISATGQDVEQVAEQIRTALPTVRDKFPNAAIVLQPLVGGPDYEPCTVDGDTVRASHTAPMIRDAVLMIADEDATYSLGATPMVASCDQYSDRIGHLTDEGAAHAARQVADAYGGDGGGGDPGDGDVELVRWSGQTRYETAAVVSAETFASADRVYVATGENYPDALAAGASGALLGSPVLLTAPTRLPSATVSEVERLGPSEIIVPGGTVAVSQDVVTALEDASGAQVRRLSGADRYATAVALARSGARGPVTTVFVASGEAFPDALTGGPLVAARSGRLVLTRPDALPDTTRSALETWQPEQIVVLGGTAAVSRAVVSELESLATGDVVRVFGPDRYATSVAISQQLFPDGGVTRVYLATGEAFPDAVGAGPAAAAAGAPVLLVGQDRLPEVVADELARLGPDEVVVIGGLDAIGTGVAEAAATAARAAG